MEKGKEVFELNGIDIELKSECEQTQLPENYI